jgi:ATP-binding cassette, subfamily B, bacterial
MGAASLIGLLRRPFERRGIALDRTTVVRVLAYVRPYRRRVVLGLACSAASSLLVVIPAFVLRDFFDYITRPHASFGHVLGLFAILLGVMLVSSALSVLQSYLAETIGHNAVAALRERLFEHLLGQSIAYYTRVRAGELLSRVMTDIAGLETILGSTLPTVIASTLTAVALLVVMVVFDWRLTLAALVLLPLVVLPARGTARRMVRTRRRVQEQFATMGGYLQETLGIAGVMLVKAFGRSSLERDRFAEINDELRRRQITADFTGRTYLAWLSMLQLLGPVLFLLFGTYLLVHGKTSLGTLLSFSLLLLVRLGAVLNNGAQGALALLSSLANWQRVFEVLDEPQAVRERSDARTLTTARGELRFEEVTFSYAGSDRAALEEVTFTAQPGQLVALVGPSGAGKTTLSSLALRFYDPDAGRVLIDGHDIRELAFASLSRLTGVVFQDTFLFNATLRDNLLYARQDADQSELDEVVRRANLESLLADLPDGYDTVVGERGYRLSGGEKQRVAIARVMLRNPRILLLDEATSHLDTVSEHLVHAAIRELFTGRTTLVIAHRLSTVIAADEIVVLDRGRVVERGTHAQLAADEGLYSRLYQTQLRFAA